VDEENYTFPEGSTLFQDTGFRWCPPRVADLTAREWRQFVSSGARE
jgi:hypothetical protein